MDLYLIRHADALALGERGITQDEDRPLSEVGEIQAMAIAQGLMVKGVAFDKLITSPLARAKRTAEILQSQGLSQPAELLITEALAPDAKPRKLARFLLKHAADRIGLVGHMPHIAAWAAWLIGGKKAQIDLAKAGVACIGCDGSARKGSGVLQWLVTPAWLGG